MPVEFVMAVFANIHQVIGIQCNLRLVNIYAIQHDFMVDNKSCKFVADLT